jgi:hypothetical protein
VAGLSALGLAAAALLAGAPPATMLTAAIGSGAAALAVGRFASPYLSRAADLLDLVLVASVVPVACAVLGLYSRIPGLV